VSKNTVKRALRADRPPQYQRAVAGSIVDQVEPRIRELLQAWPTMPATVIAERIGWTRGLTVLKDRVRELRPVYLPPDPASRTAYAAGEVAQCDLWFPDITVPVGLGQTRTASRLPVLVMVTGYARWLCARLLPSRCAEDLFAGWWQLISQLGAVPRVLVWDGEGAVGQRRRRQTVLTGQAHGFRGVLGAKIRICDPADPEAKPNTVRLGASAACGGWGCWQYADGLGGWHGGLRPGAVGGAFELVVAHLALDRPGEGPQPAFGQQHGQQLVDHHADGRGELVRGKRPAPRSPGGGRPVGCG
jgi:hypothetical protein